jgi:uncharacterized protein YbcV (DUF1398 family)
MMDMIYMKKYVNKTIATLLILSFTLTSHGPAYAYGGKPLFTYTSHAQRYGQKEHPHATLGAIPGMFHIPAPLGRVLEYHKGSGDSFIIHIQDRHMDPIAQASTAELINYINQEYNTHLVCVEGASKELDTGFYDTIKDTPSKQKTAEFFMEKGLFTGSEFFKITNPGRYIRATGIESEELYLRNIVSYNRHQAGRDLMQQEMLAVSSGLRQLQQVMYSADMQRVNSIEAAHKNKQLSFAEYVGALKQYADKAGINLNTQNSLLHFIELKEQEKFIDFTRAESERTALLKELSDKLDTQQVRMLMHMGLEFSLENTPSTEFYDYLESLITEHGLPSDDYSSLLDYIHYIRLYRQINHLDVFEQADVLSDAVKEALCSTPQQKELLRHSIAASLLDDLYNLALTPKKLDYIKQNPHVLDTRPLLYFIEKASSNYGINNPLYAYSPEPQAGIYAMDFYNLAVERDIALAENTIRRMSQYRTNMAILIAGGFHTKGITKLLKEKDISYIVICPTIGLDNCDKAYSRRMNGELLSPADIEGFFAQALAPPSIIAPIVTADGLKERAQGLFRLLTEIHAAENATFPQPLNDTVLQLQNMPDEIMQAAQEIFAKQIYGQWVSGKEITADLVKQLLDNSIEEAVRHDIDLNFSYDPVRTQNILPTDKIYDYRDPVDRSLMEDMIQNRNWYYHAYTEDERAALIAKTLGGFSEAMIDELKGLVVGALAEQDIKITREDIASILVYGSWCYMQDEFSDLDLAVIIEGDTPKTHSLDIKIPPSWFLDSTMAVPMADVKVIGTKKLLDPPGQKDPYTIDFELSMPGHGILLFGKDFLQYNVPAHNMLVKARTLIFIARLYAEGRIEDDLEDAKGIVHSQGLAPELLLRKVFIRLDEVEKIFNILYSDKHLGIGDKDQGRQPAMQAISDAKRVLLEIKDRGYHETSALVRALDKELAPHISAAMQQTQTQFAEDQLQEIEFRRRIQGLQQASQDTQGLSDRASSAGIARKIVKGAGKILTIFLIFASIYCGATVYRDWNKAYQRNMDAYAAVHEMAVYDKEGIIYALQSVYNLSETIQGKTPSQHMTGKTWLVLEEHVKANQDYIIEYAREYNIDPVFLAAVILTEQMDMIDHKFIQETSTDKIGGLLGRDTSIGLAQIKMSTFQELCAGMTWPQYNDKPTEKLSNKQIVALLQDPRINIMAAAKKIAHAEQEIRQSFPDVSEKDFKLMVAQAYTSSARGLVPEPPYTDEQLEKEQYRTYAYAHWVLINERLVLKLKLFVWDEHSNKHVLYEGFFAGNEYLGRPQEKASSARATVEPDLLWEAIGYNMLALKAENSLQRPKEWAFITNVKSFTETDILFLNTFEQEQADIIVIDDAARQSLHELGFTGGIAHIDEYDFLSPNWAGMTQEEKIAKAAVFIRGQYTGVFTVTDDKIAQAIPRMIDNSKKDMRDDKIGAIVVASMQGAAATVQLGTHTITQDDILFSITASDAMNKAQEILKGYTADTVFILDPLPSIDSQAFERFINDLIKAKRSYDAALSAA